MGTSNRFQERRSLDRPANGATARCPKCRQGLMEFSERYRLPTFFDELAAIPAWVCDGPDCHYWRPARRVTGRSRGRPLDHRSDASPASHNVRVK